MVQIQIYSGIANLHLMTKATTYGRGLRPGASRHPNLRSSGFAPLRCGEKGDSKQTPGFCYCQGNRGFSFTHQQKLPLRSEKVLQKPVRVSSSLGKSKN